MSTRSRVLVWLSALAGAALVVAAVGALLAAPLARHLTRQALSSLKGVHGSFLSARIDPLTLTYSLENLKLVADDARPTDPPLLTVGHLEIRPSRRDLLHGKLTASVVIENAKLATRLTKRGAATVPDPGAELRRLPSLRLRRVELRDCEVLLTDATVFPSATLWVHEIEADLERLATRPGVAWAQAPSFTLHGVVQRSGKLSASGTLDPLASVPTFEGEVHLTDLQLSEQYALIAPRTGLQIPEGTVNVTGTFKASNGRLRGKLQPVFSGVEVRSAGGNVLKSAEAVLANAKIGTIPDRFASSHPMILDLTWTNLGTLWDELVNGAQEAFLEALNSAVAPKEPTPRVSSPKGSPTRRQAGSHDRGSRAP